MDKNNTAPIIIETQVVLKDLISYGQGQVAKLEAENSVKVKFPEIYAGKKYILVNGIMQPFEEVAVKEIIKPKNFISIFLSSFWNFYNMISDRLEDPLIQFGMRTLLEICYSKIIFFGLLPEEKQQEKAIQYWMCYSGILATDKKNKIFLDLYKKLINHVKPSEKKFYENQQKNNFEKKEAFFKKIERTFPGVTSEYLFKQIEPHLKTIIGTNLSADTLQNMHTWLSQYLHGNIFLLNNVVKAEKDKNHLYKVSVILFLTGYRLSNFCNEKFFSKDKEEQEKLEKVNEKIKVTVPKIKNYTSKEKISFLPFLII
ncbi:MAG: hypothetical protein PHI88_01540 [Candidatus Pacebacteria bacterium]|nr:hypothetical protein [Candidatus Paceibacterota bacterium]